MTPSSLPVAVLFVGVGLVAACASEHGLGPADQSPERSGPDDWTQVESGNLPRDLIAFNAQYQVDGEDVEALLIMDFHGNVVSQWQPPPAPYWDDHKERTAYQSTSIGSIRSHIPGRVDVEIRVPRTAGTGTLTAFTLGDLTDGSWTPMAEADLDQDSVVVAGTEAALLPIRPHSEHGASFAPYGVDGTSFMHSRSGATRYDMPGDLTFYSVADPEQRQTWRLDAIAPAAAGSAIKDLRGGLDAQGRPTFMLETITEGTREAVFYQWSPGEEAVEVVRYPATDVLEWVWDPESGMLLAGLNPDAAIEWLNTGRSQEVAGRRPIAILDVEQRAYLTMGRIDEHLAFAVYAGDQEVWRIERFRLGFQDIDVEGMTAAALISEPLE